ncbi:L,D-transpeptidase [Candidatus Berkiella cookevillensis]|uniref:L,D-transpeptidase n=1 Tax=Candidatus Berkiella cookevillensis TaxID=437022 RepID=A0A0Q9YM11_9GAMM|nr:L,D-transpeptidase [Candidatus Berkiella cookevillensis]MCS5708031.1 L,D-transpeptidase [Candidatus Berkiella cookevillensis]
MVAHALLVDVETQALYHFKDSKITKKYLISTAKNGVGEEMGSEKTPRGWHIIRAKIGDNQPINSVFVRRRPSGEIYSPDFSSAYPGRDWILTRILWLSGLEVGKNRFGNCDTMKRYIYIHGSPDTKVMGVPSSKGCINMHNNDILELYSDVPVGTTVLIRG